MVCFENKAFFFLIEAENLYHKQTDKTLFPLLNRFSSNLLACVTGNKLDSECGLRVFVEQCSLSGYSTHHCGDYTAVRVGLASADMKLPLCFSELQKLRAARYYKRKLPAIQFCKRFVG